MKPILQILLLKYYKLKCQFLYYKKNYLLSNNVTLIIFVVSSFLDPSID
jgi:hypothetical protein